MLKRRQIVLLALLTLVVSSGFTTSCAANPAGNSEHAVMMTPLDQMPVDVQSAPVLVQQAYQFAVANPEVTQHIPCYCGCGAMGHTSNYACFAEGVEADGSITFDSHALGCSICVDIAQDAMRLLSQGQGVSEIKTYVDTTYSKYGPSNMP